MKAMKKTRPYLLTFILLGFFILLLIDPESVLETGRKAVDLCLNIILPSLLPFFIVSRLILNTGVIHTISRFFKTVMGPLFNLPGAAAFPLIAGWFSGYPAGAKYTVDLYHQGLINQEQAERLLAFCNNSGPLFLIGAVGTGYFKSPKLGFTLLLCHLLASITVGIGSGFISRVKNGKSTVIPSQPPQDKIMLSGQLLTDAIFDSVRVLLQISGTIIFFAVFVQTLETAGVFSFISSIITLVTGSNSFLFDSVKVFFAGSLEITYGLFLLSQASGIPLHFKLLMTGFLCGFGGFSVHTQVTGLCPTDFQLKRYIFGKAIHGMIAAVYTGLFMLNQTVPVMNTAPGLIDMKISKDLLLVYALLLTGGIVFLIRSRWFGRKRL